MNTPGQNARRIRIGAWFAFSGFVLVGVGGFLLFSLYAFYWAASNGGAVMLLALLLGPLGLVLIGRGFQMTFGAIADEVEAGA